MPVYIVTAVIGITGCKNRTKWKYQLKEIMALN